MIKTKAILLLSVLTMASIFPILFAQGQSSLTIEEKIVNMAEKAASQVENLLVLVNDEGGAEKIENTGLTEQFEDNATLYKKGLAKLDSAKQALATSDDEIAVNSAIDALKIFREVYSSLNIIMKTSGIEQTYRLNDNQEISDAIARELQRIDSLREIIGTDAPNEITGLLENTEEVLNEANGLLLEDKISEVKNLYVEAKQDIVEVYQYLKETAEYSNVWRLSGYCERLQERAQERFRYGQEQKVDLTSTLSALGYQSEADFMNVLNNQIQNAQNQKDFKNAIVQCQELSQLVQNMENAVNQEINRQQGGSGNGGSGAGDGSGYGSSSGAMGGGN